MVMSFFYWALRRLLERVVVRGRGDSAKEIELLVLIHEIAVLRRRKRAHQLERLRAPMPSRSLVP
jgi:hypothetical protein